MVISSNLCCQLTMRKNPQCLKSRPQDETSLGIFLEEITVFQQKDPSLVPIAIGIVTFCFKTKSKKNDLVKILNFLPPESFSSPTLKGGSFLRKLKS